MLLKNTIKPEIILTKQIHTYNWKVYMFP